MRRDEAAISQTCYSGVMSIRHRWSDLVASVRYVPGVDRWLWGFAELVWAVPLLLLIAHFGGLVHASTPPDATTTLVLLATLFIAPALGEELLFRGMIIARDHPSRTSIIMSVVLFVLWHPLQAITIGPPWSRAFLDPIFLLCVAVLGTALARIYVATKSLWPAVVIHWLVVASWKLFLGGPF
jgi:predicted Abi (CAAX) family protease